MISVVAAVRDRAHNVERWLDSLGRQTEPLEVVLVDYGSSDGLEKVLKSSPFPVSLLRAAPLPVEGFPEAYLKNCGIQASTSDVVACTNVDLCYEPTFFEHVRGCCAESVLVMAMRRNAGEGVEVLPDGSTEEGPDASWSTVIDGLGSDISGFPLIAAADLQAMTASGWRIMRGYDEEIVGWGTLDSDLTMRAMLWGMSVVVLGHRAAVYTHTWHALDLEEQEKSVRRNHRKVRDKINCGTVTRNPGTWGGMRDGFVIEELEREAQV